MSEYKLTRKVACTSQIFQIFITASNATTFAGVTGLAYNTATLVAYYHKDLNTTATAITLADMTVGTFTSGGFKEVDATNMPGVYQFCPPNAAFSTGGSVMFSLQGIANMRQVVIEVDLTPVASDMVQIDGSATNGNNATLRLAQLNITNSSGHALVLAGGSNGNGAIITGNGTASGISVTGGATGHGIHSIGGATSGTGITAIGGGNGVGIAATATSNNSGFFGSGSGSGHGIQGSGGTTGSGLVGVGGATSGSGIVGSATTSGAGLSLLGVGSGNSGIVAAGGTNGAGALITGNGTGQGAIIQGGATGNGLSLVGGATSGAGLYSYAVGSGAGITAIGVGATSVLATQGISGALDAAVYTSISDALLKRDMSAITGESSRSLLNCLRFIRNKWSVSSNTITITKEDDATTAWTAALTTDAAALPVISFDGSA